MTSRETELELVPTRNDFQPESDVRSERELPTLPAVDTSREAWAFVLAAFMVETLLWGPLFSVGVFTKHYSLLPAFRSSTEPTISLIGTLALCFGYGLGLPLLFLYNRYPRSMKPTIWLGLGLNTVSLLLASAAPNITLLIICQGIGPGVAAALCAFPIIRWIPDCFPLFFSLITNFSWFHLRKGTAMGIVFSGGGVGGVYMPLLNEVLIDKVGYQWTLRISALMTFALAGTAIVFVNPRLPISRTTHVTPSPMSPMMAVFLRRGFFEGFLSTMLQGFGFFTVGLFIPRFSDTLSGTAGAGLLSAFNVSMLFAQVIWGFITDRTRPASAMASSSFLGCVVALTMWGVGGGTGLPVLAPFAIAFGLSTGGYSSMWSQTAYSIVGRDGEKQTMLLSGFSIARAIGAATGPIIGAALYRTPEDSASYNNVRFGSAGSPGLVALVAASLAASAIAALASLV